MTTKLLLAALLLITISVSPAYSQPVSNPTPTLEETKTSLERLKSDYFFQVDQYRKVREVFSFDLAEYNQLPTLANEEKLVASFRQILEARTQVLTTYLFAIQEQLSNTQAIDVGDKQVALDLINDSLARVNAHQKNISALVERTQANTESFRFEAEDVPVFFEATYRSLALFNIGRIQSVTDQVLVAGQDFEEQVVNLEQNETIKAAMNRGLTRFTEQYNQAAAAVSQARSFYSQFDSAKRDRQFKPQSIYQNSVEALNPAFASLWQAIEFLIELERNS